MAVVSVTKHIPASKDSLWEAISSERNLENFHPFCQSNNVKKYEPLNVSNTRKINI